MKIYQIDEKVFRSYIECAVDFGQMNPKLPTGIIVDYFMDRLNRPKEQTNDK